VRARYRRNGNSFFNSSLFGCRPYSQTSNASAYFTCLPALRRTVRSASRGTGRRFARSGAGSSRASGQTPPSVPLHSSASAPHCRGPAFDELGFERRQGVDLLFDHTVDCDEHVGPEGIGRLEVVERIQDTGFFFSGGVSRHRNGTATMYALSCINTPV